MPSKLDILLLPKISEVKLYAESKFDKLFLYSKSKL